MVDEKYISQIVQSVLEKWAFRIRKRRSFLVYSTK